MGIDIRLPPQLDGLSEKEQLKQYRSYLFQLATQLQWALNNIDTSSNPVVVKAVTKSIPTGSQSAESAESIFTSLKPLIIKSADIVTAYYEEINKRLVGEYVAQSDFGIFEEQTSQDVYENSTSINRTLNHVQEIKAGVDSSLEALSGEIDQVDNKATDTAEKLSGDIQALKNQVEALNYSIIEVTANVNSGLLYYNTNGVPVYGFEIGQKNVVDGVEVFNKFARFTADRLSFYDHSGTEVAYISDYRLYIYNVEITGIYKIGGLVDTVLANGDVVEKWVGRG